MTVEMQSVYSTTPGDWAMSVLFILYIYIYIYI